MIKLDDLEIKLEYFPDGTLKLNSKRKVSKIYWRFEGNEEQLVLYYLVKHIREANGVAEIDLIMPYIPNARMDRVKSDNEVFTLKYFCQFINELKFNNVYVEDSHSACSLIGLNGVVQMGGVKRNIEKIIKDISPDVLFFPDEGSMKRYSEMVKFPFLFGIKNRDWESGKIKSLEMVGEKPNELFDVLIVDDICSYGGTFLKSAQRLKENGARKIYLYVTHCENSILDGELINSGMLEKIYTTDSIFTKAHSLIEIV